MGSEVASRVPRRFPAAAPRASPRALNGAGDRARGVTQSVPRRPGLPGTGAPPPPLFRSPFLLLSSTIPTRPVQGMAEH